MSSLDTLWALLLRAAVLWYACFAVWALLLWGAPDLRGLIHLWLNNWGYKVGAPAKDFMTFAVNRLYKLLGLVAYLDGHGKYRTVLQRLIALDWGTSAGTVRYGYRFPAWSIRQQIGLLRSASHVDVAPQTSLNPVSSPRAGVLRVS